ncbi:hypothetical protein A8C32_05565 [Flavivirga aquatica]|uniref:DUF1214 domain-containing protein n=1 Tax=Flavivirga aquatica TaxID=1849968 RepID=A0A1E5SHQ6_9FLAO|nr:DUF1214 domain-containing protein [Flavivirga aquatica]OEJ98667.1 hypothetical protein A8C32_05565 [Flavivirga aquatica]
MTCFFNKISIFNQLLVITDIQYPYNSPKNIEIEQNFINLSGIQFNTIHANNFKFYEELNAVVQYEPATAFDPETVGMFASIGIKKGEIFAPNSRMSAILKDAVKVANATARALTFAPRKEKYYYYPGERQWYTCFAEGVNYDFMNQGEMVLNDRAFFHYYATGITPQMVKPEPGTGSVYAITSKDVDGNYLNGANTYMATLPKDVPVENFWSFMVYDGQTRSMLETDQKKAGLDSNKEELIINPDGSCTIYFGPYEPANNRGNWIQTMPNKSFNVILRLYGPLNPWFDKDWIPGDLELITS